MGFGNQGLGYRVWAIGIWGWGIGVWELGFRASGYLYGFKIITTATFVLAIGWYVQDFIGFAVYSRA